MARKRVSVSMPSIEDINIEVHLTGDWEKAEHVIDNLSPTIKRGYDIAVEKFSKKLLRVIKSAILSGKPPENSGVYWQELAESTIKRYGNHKIYNLTGLYARSIGLFQYSHRTYVGLQHNKRRASQGGLTLNQLAVLLEHGSKGGSGNIPPRPLWAPSLKTVGGIKALDKQIVTEIRRKMRTDLGINPNQIR